LNEIFVLTGHFNNRAPKGPIAVFLTSSKHIRSRTTPKQTASRRSAPAHAKAR